MDPNPTSGSSQMALCDALDKMLTKGVSAHGDITISVAGVELLYIGIRGLICAIDALDQRPQSLVRSVRPISDNSIQS